MQITKDTNARPIIQVGNVPREYVPTMIEEAIPALVTNVLARSAYICLESGLIYLKPFVFASK